MVKILTLTVAISMLAIAIILLIINIIYNPYGQKNIAEENYYHSWTKAICSETICQDYVIECEGKKLIRQNPITGAVINIPKNWSDTRTPEEKNRICE